MNINDLIKITYDNKMISDATLKGVILIYKHTKIKKVGKKLKSNTIIKIKDHTVIKISVESDLIKMFNLS